MPRRLALACLLAFGCGGSIVDPSDAAADAMLDAPNETGAVTCCDPGLGVTSCDAGVNAYETERDARRWAEQMARALTEGPWAVEISDVEAI